MPDSWGLWLDERAVEYPWFFSRLPETPGKLLDAGSTLNYDYVLSHRKLNNKTISIFTLAPESEAYWQKGISYIYGDLRDCCCRDEFFDWAVSISTLEHVGMDNTRHYTKDVAQNESRPDSHLSAVLELRRVLKPGGVLYVTLPYGQPQNLGWMQIFDANKTKKLVETFDPASCREIYFRYLPSGWQISSAAECSDASYFDISKSDGSCSDFAAAECVVCLELMK